MSKFAAVWLIICLHWGCAEKVLFPFIGRDRGGACNSLLDYPCNWAHNATGDYKSMSEMQSYSTCVVGYLGRKFLKENVSPTHLSVDHDDDFKKILLEPPGKWGEDQTDSVDLQIENFLISRIEEMYGTTDMHVSMEIHVQWTDSRLVWDSDSNACLHRGEIRFTEEDLKDNSNRIWLPNFVGDNDPYYRWSFVTVAKNGTVHGDVSLSTPMDCAHNYKKYPFDKAICHFWLVPHSPFVDFEHEKPGQSSEKIMVVHGFTEFPPNWILDTLSEFKYKARVPIGYGNTKMIQPAQLSLDLTLKRRSQFAYRVSVLFISTSVTLGIFGPMTGSLSLIIFTKVMAMATAFGGLVVFAFHKSQLYKSANVPQIVIAFELSLALSLLSLILCLLHCRITNFYGSRVAPKIHKVPCGLINSLFRWIPTLSNGEKQQASLPVPGTPDKAVDNNEDWQIINDAINRFSFAFFTLCYTIGTLVLMS